MNQRSDMSRAYQKNRADKIGRQKPGAFEISIEIPDKRGMGDINRAHGLLPDRLPTLMSNRSLRSEKNLPPGINRAPAIIDIIEK